MATPFTPLVVTALGREMQKKNKLTEAQYQSYMDELMFSTLGMFVDWYRGQYVDKDGNYYKNESQQLDSLLFLITLKNKTHPCIPPIFVGFVGYDLINGVGVMGPLWRTTDADWCYFPDISNLEKRITLRNDKNEEFSPRFVWGSTNSVLEDEETLFVMFSLRDGSSHFLRDADEVYLEISGFEQPIRVKIDVSLLQ